MSKNKRLIDPAIIAAIIGVMGTLCVTLISLYANRVLPQTTPAPTSAQASPQATWTEPPPATITNTAVPTDTVPAGEPTSTAAPDTQTPEPSFTPAPPVIGSDWANGCISVVWRPYPQTVQTTANNGCLTITDPINLFFAGGGRLTFVVNRKFDEPQIYGLFAPLPASGTVSVSSFVRTLEEGEIWMGIFAEPDIASQGTVIAIPPGDERGRDRQLIQRSLPGQEEIKRTDTFPPDPPYYTVVFGFNNEGVTIQKLLNTEFDAVPLDSPQKWFFVGYQAQSGGNRVNIDAEFLNLVLQGQ